MKKKAKIEKRFQLLLSEEELEYLKTESEMRGISASEILRIGLRNEITHKTSLERIHAIEDLAAISIEKGNS